MSPSRLLLPTLLLAACGAGDGTPAGPPNVVLVTLDTTRPDYLSCYPPGRPGTPVMQRLADEGVRFDAALSASGVTPVSHATILTGAFPYEHGLRVLSAGSGFRLPEDQPTIASVLRSKGYHTAAIHSAFPVSGYFGFAKDYDEFLDLAGDMTVNESAGKTEWDGLSLQRRSDATAALVLDWLDRRARDDRPFFLWLHLWDPHDPGVMPPKEYISHIVGAGSYSAATEVYAQVYAAEIRFMDKQLGVVLDGISERGHGANTLVCVTADHGEGLRDGFELHGWSKHRMTYQEQIHVPLLLRGPGVPAGRSVQDMVRTADIVPTLLDYAGFASEFPGGAGRSLRPLLEGHQLAPAIAYADQINGYDANAGMVGARPDAAFLHTVCDGRWKLIYRPHMVEESELFDLVRNEKDNLILEEREVYLRLMADLAARDPWVMREFPIGEHLDPDAVAKFNAIGYGGGDEDDGSEGGAGDRVGKWTWFCPAHPEYEREQREGPAGTKRHGEDGCQQPVVPRTTWTPKSE